MFPFGNVCLTDTDDRRAIAPRCNQEHTVEGLDILRAHALSNAMDWRGFMIRMFFAPVAVALLVGGGPIANAQSTSVSNPAAYDMGRYLTDQQYRTDAPLQSRCLSEEKKGRLTPTCQQYKRDLNRLLRKQSAV